MITKFKLFENIENKNHGILIKTGERFCIGSVNVMDGEIEEVHTFEEAESHDFHHSFYFSQPQLEKISNDECKMFCVNNNGILNWSNIPDSIIRKIRKQVITQFILFESNSVKEDLSTLFDDLFEHKLVRGRTLYFSSRLNKGGKPMCIIDPKDELKALTLMVQSKKIIIKVIVNKTKEKGLGKKIVDRLVKFADKNSYQVMIDDDQSKGFWDAQISKYGNKLQKIDEGLLDYFKKKEIEVDPNKTHYEMGDFLLVSPKNSGDCKAIVIRDMLEDGKNILDKKYIYDEFWFNLTIRYNNDYKIGDPIYKGRKKGRLSYHEEWLKNVDSVGIRDKIWKVIRSKEFKDILDQSNL